MALALNKSAEILNARNKTLENFTYADKEMAEVLRDSLSKVKFLGFSVSGTFILIFKATVSKYPERAKLSLLSLQLSPDPAGVTRCQPRSQGSLLPVPTARERTWERG